jgi:hypothetical protein
MRFSFRTPLFSTTFVLLAGIVAPMTAQPNQPLTEKCSHPQFPSAQKTAIDDRCGIDGTGTGADATQDSIKNNFCAPGPANPITFDDLQQLQAAVEANKSINFGNQDEHPLSTTPGPTTDRTPLTQLGEGQLRVIEGYVMIARQEGAETVNCSKDVPNQPVYHDIHISLVPDEQSIHGDECEAVVVEMSPHHRPSDWTAANVEWVSSKHARVRVTGQLFFDSSHSPCNGGGRNDSDPARFSLWEIHPIYKFEVCTATDCSTAANWLSLHQWLQKNPASRQPRRRSK